MRNRRALLFLLLSVVSGLAAVIAYRTTMPEPVVSTAPPVITTVPTAIAGEVLPPGVAIQASQIEMVEWPVDYQLRGSIHSAEEVAERIPRRRIESGEPIFEQLLVERGRHAGLTALIESGHRAMSVETNAVVGVGGFIQPGSRVDVLAQFRTRDRERGPLTYNRTILQNVKVLAIDQIFDVEEDHELTPAAVVTLEVDPNEAQLLAFATAEGTLQLALRNSVDGRLVSLRSTKPEDFIDDLPEPQPNEVGTEKAPGNAIEIIRGATVTREYL